SSTVPTNNVRTITAPVRKTVTEKFENYIELAQPAIKQENPICLDTLSRAGQMPDRNGLTNVGRALQKHGSRPKSAFPRVNGKASSINEQGQFILDEILTDPYSTIKFSHKTKYGNVLDIKASSGRGVRYNQ